MTLVAGVQYTVGAAANAGAAVLHRSPAGSPEDATAAAQAIVDANTAGLLPKAMTFDEPPAITISDGKISVTIKARQSAWFEMFQDSVTAESTASA